MTMNSRIAGTVALLALATGCAQVEHYHDQLFTTFFVTSKGAGRGADFGGLSGADGHCQALATAAALGAGNRTWRAYLSTSASRDSAMQHARERIGPGPWRNAKGVLIARNVEELHSNNNINKETALTEKGEKLNGAGDTPNMHDILTGSQPNGMAIGGAEDRTCGNWTRSGAEGSAMVGHHDRTGLGDDAASKSWNSSHPTRGCGEAALRSTGGDGRLYCFAAN
jgi:hypothetical protein